MEMLTDETYLAEELAKAYTRIRELESAHLSLESNHQFEHYILQNMSDGVVLIRMENGEIVFTNSAFDKMFGYAQGELLGCHVSVLTAQVKHRPESLYQEIKSRIEKHGVWTGEIQNCRKDGSYFWTNAKINDFDHPQFGKVWISVRQDLTRQKGIEQKLREKDIQFQKLIDVSPMPYAVTDENDNIKYLNSAFVSTFGYDLNDIPTLAVWREKAYPDEIYRKNIRANWNQFRESVAEKKSLDPRELSIRCKSGEFRTVIASFSSMGVNNESKHLGAFVDITERKKQEQELLKLHQELNDLQYTFDNVGIGVHIVEIDGSFAYVNHVAATMLGYTQQEMLSKKLFDINKNLNADNFLALSLPFRQNPVVHRIETTQTTKDGRELPFEVTFRFIQNKNGGGRFLSFLVDLSDKKQAQRETERLQRQLYQAQKMESVGQLTGGIAHDFNNILTPIIGFAELIKGLSNNAELSVKKRQSYADEIISAGMRAKELIAQLLVYSRGRMNSSDNSRLTRIKPILEEVIALLRSSLPSSIQLILTADKDNISAVIEPVHLHQIVMNLCINARDSINQYGGISVHLSCEHVANECVSCHQVYAGDYVKITIEDSGTGIDEMLLARVFEPFFTTKDVGAGSGMGLSVVHGLVHSMGGHISVESELDFGTSVHIYLPVTMQKTEPFSGVDKTEREKQRASLSGLKVLVVDDEPAIVSMLDDLLSMHGAIVTRFQDSSEALRYFENDPGCVDMVLSDQTMPKLTGLDMASRMLQLQPGLPIIICSGYSELINEENVRSFGIAAFIKKPVNFSYLLNEVSEIYKSLCSRSHA